LRPSPSWRSAFVVGAAALAVALAYLLVFRSSSQDCSAGHTSGLENTLALGVPALAIVALWAAATDIVRARPQRWLTGAVAFLVLLAAGLFEFFLAVSATCPVF
jgi:hypothetical protein